jgi:hypothetical protein
MDGLGFRVRRRDQIAPVGEYQTSAQENPHNLTFIVYDFYYSQVLKLLVKPQPKRRILICRLVSKYYFLFFLVMNLTKTKSVDQRLQL